LVALARLLAATEQVEKDQETDEDLRILLAPGSSLGGARPKASIRDTAGHLAIAKFPHQQDEVNVVLWEAVALSLAAHAGIRVPDCQIAEVDRKQVLVARRFDRAAETRIPSCRP